MPSASEVLEFETPTFSTVIDGPTVVTFLETQQESSPTEGEQIEDSGKSVEGLVEVIAIIEGKQQPLLAGSNKGKFKLNYCEKSF